MKAIVQDCYGSADVLELRDVKQPHISDDEVLVAVRAAGVDRGVWHLMAGLPYLTRLMFGLRAPKTPVPGMDLAGVVEAVGGAVTRFQPGDEVFGVGVGTYAELARAPEAKLAPKPASLTFGQAAVVPISGMTALQGVRDHGKVQRGHKVLILGASGGVGSYAVQIAKAHGAEVTGVCRTTKVAFVTALGADYVIDHTTQDFADGHERYDVILDMGGRSSLSRLRRALTRQATLVIVGGEGGGRWLGGFDRQLRALVLSPLVGQRLTTFISPERLQDLLGLAELIDAGKVTPAVDRTFALADAAEAITYLEEGHAQGKLAITV